MKKRREFKAYYGTKYYPYCYSCKVMYIDKLRRPYGDKDKLAIKVFLKEKWLHDERGLRAFRVIESNYPEIFTSYRKYLRWMGGVVRGHPIHPITNSNKKYYYYQRGKNKIQGIINNYG